VQEIQTTVFKMTALIYTLNYLANSFSENVEVLKLKPEQVGFELKN